MRTALKRKKDLIKVKQFVTNSEGQKVAAIIEMEELSRIEGLLKVIPPSEAWLYQNKEAVESVQKGLKEASEGKISKLNLSEI
jgi:ABC-type nitrate/sulfonate/bicarbonate transport system substrate-binding protein